jgi:hypothetical protein
MTSEKNEREKMSNAKLKKTHLGPPGTRIRNIIILCFFFQENKKR